MKTRKGTKRDRMMAAYDGFKGPQTVNAVFSQIPEELQEQLTGRQLGLVMSAINRAYHTGVKKGEEEITDYICLPNGVDVWAVIGDSDYLGCKVFPDGLHIPNILEARGHLVAQWKKEA